MLFLPSLKFYSSSKMCTATENAKKIGSPGSRYKYINIQYIKASIHSFIQIFLEVPWIEKVVKIYLMSFYLLNTRNMSFEGSFNTILQYIPNSAGEDKYSCFHHTVGLAETQK
jgi:hypothetical protein